MELMEFTKLVILLSESISGEVVCACNGNNKANSVQETLNLVALKHNLNRDRANTQASSVCDQPHDTMAIAISQICLLLLSDST